MARQDPEVGRAERPGGVGEFLPPELQHLSPHQPGHAAPGEEADHEDDAGDRPAQVLGEDNEDGEVRERQRYVRDAHEHIVQPPSVETGGGADEDARACRRHRRREAHEQRDAAGIEQPREDIVPDGVGTEDVT